MRLQLAEQRKYSILQPRISLHDVSRRRPSAICEAGEQANVHVVDAIDRPNEQQLFIDTRFVSHHASGQGAAESTPLIP